MNEETSADGKRSVVMRPRGGAADGEATRVALIEAALRLFATQSIDSVSVRAINREAGAAPAAVHYHFGSKEALVVAVVDRYGAAVNAAISNQIRAVLERPGQPGPGDLVAVLSDAYRQLLIQNPESGRAWLNVVAQLSIAADPLFDDAQSSVNALLHDLAGRVFPDADPARVRSAVRLGAITLIQMTVQDAGAMDELIAAGPCTERNPAPVQASVPTGEAAVAVLEQATPGMLARFIAGGLVAAIND